MFRENNQTLYAVYDLAISPITFDFMHFAVISHMAARANGYKYVHFVFTLGVNRTWRDATPKDKALDDKTKLWRLNHIQIPIATMVESYAGHSVYLDRVEAAKELAALIPQMIFPPQYHVNNPQVMFMLSQVVDIHKQITDQVEGTDITPVCLEPNLEAISMAEAWIDHRGIDVDKLVTITVRQATIEPHRNSNMKSWSRFAKHLEKEGYVPVFLVDTEVAMIGDAEALAKHHHIYWPGPVNLDLRVALYSLAKYNLAHNGGPAALNFFLKGSKFLEFLPVDATPDVVKNEGTIAGHERLLAVKDGEDYAFSNGQAKYVWEKATFDNILKNFNKLVEDTSGE